MIVLFSDHCLSIYSDENMLKPVLPGLRLATPLVLVPGLLLSPS